MNDYSDVAAEEIETEVLESPDGDPRKRGEIHYAHVIKAGENGTVMGPMKLDEPLSPRGMETAKPMSQGMILQAKKNSQLIYARDMGEVSSILYPNARELKDVFDAVKDSERGLR